MLTLSGAGQPQNGVGIEERFVISVKTDNAGTSLDNQYTIPMVNSVPYDIKTSDGQTINNVINNYTITFPTPGTYEVKLSPSSIDGSISLDNNYAADKYKLINVLNWGVNNIANLNGLFSSSGIIAISAIDIPVLNNPNGGVNLHQVFGNTSSLLDVPNLELWDTSDVSSFRSSFYNSKLFSNENENTLDLSNWDTSNVNDFSYMFYMGNGKGKVDFNMGAWNIENMTQAISFYAGYNAQPISIENYNSTLISWAAQNANSNISISFGNSQYSYEGAAARQTLIDTYGWTITDGGQAVAPEFALKWETTTPNEEIQIGVGDGTFDYVIDWGDGTVENYTTNDNISHTYATAGDYITKITGDFPHINMGQGSISLTFKYKLKDILNWGSQTWESLQEGFMNCDRLTVITAGDTPDLSNVTSISNVLTNLNDYVSFDSLSNWNVSNVSNFSGALYLGYNKPLPDLSNWDFSNATNLSSFVKGTDFNQDVSSWDVSNVTNMGELFGGTPFNQDISGWDISGVTNMVYMFRDTPFNQDISSWNISNVTNLYGMFQSTPFNQDISGWDVSNVTIFNFMFLNATAFNQPIGLWNTSNLQGANQFLYGATSFDQSLANWDITNMPDNPRSYQGLPNFLTNVTISTANYDATLISWSQQSTALNINTNFGNSQYTLGGAAEAARNTLINTYGWTITDGGGVFVGLLDTYPNASAAYSLRDLASASVGSAVVRVRRSSDNLEQDFTATEITDGTLTTFTGVNDGFVTTWYDQSGNSVNAVQATATLQPKLVTSGVVRQVNNKPALTLFSNNVGFSTNTSYAGSDFSIVSVYDKTLSAGADTIFLDNNLNSPDGIFSYRNGSKQGVYRSGDKTIEGNLKDGQAIAFTLLSNNVISYYNNTDLVGSSTDANAAANVDFNSFRIGRANPFEIQEVILYPTNQTPNVQGFNDNMNNHYSVYEVPVSGLLFDYPDSLVAYSLRQLTTFESGNKVNVVRVRRSNDNVEKDFIDTEITDGTLTTFTGANDGFVVKWYDQSGDLNDAIQTSAVNQPKLVDNGTVILDNGKPAIKYDSTGFDTFTTLNNVTGINSIFYVLNAETSTGGPTQSLLGDNFGNLDYVSGQSSDILLWTGVPNDIKNGSNYIDSQPYNFLATDRPLVQSLITMIHNSPIGAFNQISEDRSIGRSWEGKLQELVVYSSDQSANRTGIETNINTEYTIY